jgi:hypothetical protein
MHVESEQRRRATRIRRPATGGFFTRSKPAGAEPHLSPSLIDDLSAPRAPCGARRARETLALASPSSIRRANAAKIITAFRKVIPSPSATAPH